MTGSFFSPDTFFAPGTWWLIAGAYRIRSADDRINAAPLQ
jgi:hypothetical protein